MKIIKYCLGKHFLTLNHSFSLKSTGLLSHIVEDYGVGETAILTVDLFTQRALTIPFVYCAHQPKT